MGLRSDFLTVPLNANSALWVLLLVKSAGRLCVLATVAKLNLFTAGYFYSHSCAASTDKTVQSGSLLPAAQTEVRVVAAHHRVPGGPTEV